MITGVSGRTFYLARDGKTTDQAKAARRFRTDSAATTAATDYLAQFAPVIQRHMSVTVKPDSKVVADCAA